MSADPLEPEHRVDELIEKHECGPYREPVKIELSDAGRHLTLIAPRLSRGIPRRSDALGTEYAADKEPISVAMSLLEEVSSDIFLRPSSIPKQSSALTSTQSRGSGQYPSRGMAPYFSHKP